MLRSLIVVLLAVLAAGCSRGPGGTELAEDVQARLDALFGRQVLLLRDLNRQGSAPYDPAPDGANQAIVYYNARLEFVEAYDPSDWEGLSPQLIATALGATDEGVVGLGAGSMAPGSELRAYGVCPRSSRRHRGCKGPRTRSSPRNSTARCRTSNCASTPASRASPSRPGRTMASTHGSSGPWRRGSAVPAPCAWRIPRGASPMPSWWTGARHVSAWYRATLPRLR